MLTISGYAARTFRLGVIAGALLVVLLALGPAAHATFRGHNGELVFVDMEGVYSDSETTTTLVQVCASGSHERAFLPRRWNDGPAVFSPHGRTVATDGVSLAAVTGTWERRLTRPPRRASDVEPAWSPKGGALAFTRVRYLGDYSVRSRAVRIYENGRGRFFARGFAPAWSARDRIAFVRGDPSDDTTTLELHVARVSSGSVRRLAAGYAPAWSPDGTRLVFIRRVRGQGYGSNLLPVTHVMTIRADGSGLRRLARGTGASWSPNGRLIGFRDLDGYIRVGSPSGRGLRRLARSTGPPLFSPDSRWVAYTSHRNEELHVVSVKGGSRRFVTSASEEMELLDWRAAPAAETRC